MPEISFRCPPHLYDHVPPPTPARAQIPAWYRDLSPDVFYQALGQDIPTAKRCPPFVDALLTGFYLPLSVDLDYDGENFLWRPLPTTGTEPYPTTPISFHAPEQVAATPLGEERREIVKFITFWSIDITPGWSLLITHPAHQLDLPFRTISAVVDADLYTRVSFIQIPTLWMSKGKPCRLARGTPVAQCIPVPRDVAFGAARAMGADENAALEANIRAITDTPGIATRRTTAPRARRPRASPGSDEPGKAPVPLLERVLSGEPGATSPGTRSMP